MQVIEQAGEEAEEGLLLELGALFLMHVRQNENDDGKDLREVVNLSLFIVDARRITVVLDDEDDQTGHSIQCLERISELSGFDALEVAVHGGLRADPEEERRYIFNFQDSLLRQGINEGNEGLLRRMRPLEDVDPLLEPNEQLLSKLFRLRFGGRTTRDRRGSRGSGSSSRCWTSHSAQVIQQPMNPEIIR